jgi:carnitine 3-dehydrogenase
MDNIERTAVLGAGVIGASWTALFAAAGMAVNVYDPSPTTPKDVSDYVERAWPVLLELGLAKDGEKGEIRFFDTAGDAVKDTQFVQENVPENIEIKHALFREIEPHLSPECIVSSSASGLMVSEMQEGWEDPSRFILGHPFNPPHLIPLVELLGNDKTAEGVLAAAEVFYEKIGKITIRVRREIPGHVANRLQAALWREAIHLVETGVTTVEDADKAVWAGPGLRWAAMGPHMLFHLAAGPGGLEEFCKRYKPSFDRWWDGLGRPELTPEVSQQLVEGVHLEANGKKLDNLAADRDALIVAMLKATTEKRNN